MCGPNPIQCRLTKKLDDLHYPQSKKTGHLRVPADRAIAFNTVLSSELRCHGFKRTVASCNATIITEDLVRSLNEVEILISDGCI